MMIIRTLVYILVSKLADDTLSTLKDVLDDISQTFARHRPPPVETVVLDIEDEMKT